MKTDTTSTRDEAQAELDSGAELRVDERWLMRGKGVLKRTATACYALGMEGGGGGVGKGLLVL
jgi:hypothetical protein